MIYRWTCSREHEIALDDDGRPERPAFQTELRRLRLKYNSGTCDARMPTGKECGRPTQEESPS